MRTRRHVLCHILVSLAAIPAFSPLRALAQGKGKQRRIGALVPYVRSKAEESIAAFDRGLRELGWFDGGNLQVEWRFADGDYKRLPILTKELVTLGVEVIVCFGGTVTASAAQEVTKTVPLVFGNVGDPVAFGLVDSLAHPARNATGLANLALDTVVKQLEMAKTLVPGLARVAVLYNPSAPTAARVVSALQAASRATGVKVVYLDVRSAKEVSEAFSRMAAEPPGALVVTGDAFIFQQRSQIAELALALRLPSIGAHEGYAEAGGLLSYGSNSAESYRRAASFVDRILKGAKPGDLPVEQATRLELVVNRKTAKALGIAIPAELLVLADRVIE